MSGEAKHCLVISDGRRGIENQALGLAEACGLIRSLTLQMHHVKPAAWLTALPPRLQSRLVKPDLPPCDIAIGCGRRAISPLLSLKRARPSVMTVYVQDPRIDPSHFDIVVAPEHDTVRGPNVEVMIGSPNRVTESKIIEETRQFADRLASLPLPRAALLIGGTSKTHKLERSEHAQHLAAAKHLNALGYSLLITTSRRTPDFAVSDWKKFTSDTGHVWLHDGVGPNPYFAFLGGADIILVTEDSTNMLTEACATGKPTYRLPMAGQAGKFQTLYDALEKRCGVVRYSESLEGREYTPLNETYRIAERIWARYDQKD